MSIGFLYRCEILVRLVILCTAWFWQGGGGSGRWGRVVVFADGGVSWEGGSVISWTWSLKRTVQPMIVEGVQKSPGAVGGRKFFPPPHSDQITRQHSNGIRKKPNDLILINIHWL